MDNNIHYEKFRNMDEMLKVMENRTINSVFRKKENLSSQINEIETKENFRAWIPTPKQWN